MDHTHPTLDNPIFYGRLRSHNPAPAHLLHSKKQPGTIHDIRPTISEGPLKAKTFTVQPDRPAVLAKPAPQLHPRQKSPVLPRNSVAVPAVESQPVIEAPQPAAKRLSGLHVLYAMAGVVFIAGLAVSLSGVFVNRGVAQQVSQIQHHSNSQESPPSTTKPSPSSVASYSVAPDLPKYIDISKLGVHARILSVGTTKDGALATPRNVFDTAWYNQSAKPDQAGAMVVDGHISSWTTHGVFYGLPKLVAGDKITITRGDNQQFTYLVVKSQKFDANNVDMSSLMVSQDISKPGLNLISCTGDVIPGTNEFDKRIVVYAVEQ
ncbi:MAG TPA: class F sortase [Candidatus Saccharimonadales bacterium]|nr:class F sortase [Candidatus Saccharimonadales bacterium]